MVQLGQNKALQMPGAIELHGGCTAVSLTAACEDILFMRTLPETGQIRTFKENSDPAWT